jgi:putative oxidoreductase
MLLVIGLLTRVAALGTAIDMAVAIIKVHLHGGLLGPNSFALPLSLFAISLMLVFTGCGWLGLDDFVGGGRAARPKTGWAAK